ncbi:MAG: hypothetical protein M5R36_22450 [Deltaproteobacteria bacterium]|nr:hypothetical protein [Deltaproteobacteria bacterium]
MRASANSRAPDGPSFRRTNARKLLASFSCVDHVLIFDELNPLRVVETLLPDFLVKGGDWAEDAVIGRAEVEAAGGRVLRVPPLPGRSTTDIIGKILRSG